MSRRTVLAEFETDGARFLVSDSTLLQCLQVAIEEGRLPPLGEDWIRRARGDQQRPGGTFEGNNANAPKKDGSGT